MLQVIVKLLSGQSRLRCGTIAGLVAAYIMVSSLLLHSQSIRHNLHSSLPGCHLNPAFLWVWVQTAHHGSVLYRAFSQSLLLHIGTGVHWYLVPDQVNRDAVNEAPAVPIFICFPSVKRSTRDQDHLTLA